MAEQKIEFDAECFGTIDKEKKEGCSHCDYSERCAAFKPKLAEHKENAVQNYIDKDEKQKQDIKDKKTADANHYLVSLIVFIVFGVVAWLVFQGE